MKKIFLLLAVAALAFTGCKSGDNGYNSNSSNNSSSGANNGGTATPYNGGMPAGNGAPQTTH